MRRGERTQRGGRWSDKILEMLYPHTCPLCGKVTGERICPGCKAKLEYIEEPRCMRCGKPVGKEEQEYCRDCETHPAEYERGYALWLHGGKVQRSIYQFKYHNRRIYGRFFAEELSSRYGDALFRWNIDAIIPIPLSKRKRKIRGYNQAEILARELGRLLSIPVDSRHLIRIKDTLPQKNMSVRERRSNVKDAFIWKGNTPIRGNYLLVDDIYTTGNTINYAAKALKKAGCGKVYFLTISIGQGY